MLYRIDFTEPTLKAVQILYSGRRALLALLCLICFNNALVATDSEKAPHMAVTIDVVEGTGDDPMIVLYIESKKGFAKTLYWFSEDDEWYEDLTTWDKKRSKKWKKWEEEPGIDAVMGPTIVWGGSKSCTIPLQIGDINILDGSYRLRIEQCKDKGGHFKKFKLPLPSDFNGGVIEDTIGYMKRLEIKVIR